MKIFKGLFMVVCVCVMCVFNAGVADAENWIAKDSYGTAQWDADSVYSNDFGNIIIQIMIPLLYLCRKFIKTKCIKQYMEEFLIKMVMLLKKAR